MTDWVCKSDHQVLAEARALVERDGGWTKGAYCRNSATGNEMAPHDTARSGWAEFENVDGHSFRALVTGCGPDQFCLEGAIRQAAGYWELNSFDVHNSRHPITAQVKRLDSLVYMCTPYIRDGNDGWGAVLWSLHAYNDLGTTSQEDAVLTLKYAQEKLDETGMT